MVVAISDTGNEGLSWLSGAGMEELLAVDLVGADAAYRLAEWLLSPAGQAAIDNADGFKSAIAHAATRGLLPDSGRLIGTAIRAQRGAQSTIFTQQGKVSFERTISASIN